MADEDSSQEKTEEPTERKIQKSKDDGQTARSKELNTTAILLFGSLGLVAFGSYMSEKIYHIARFNLDVERAALFDTSSMFSHMSQSMWEAVSALVPWFILVIIAAFLSPLGVGGWIFSTKALAPKASRLSPLAGIKRMFSANSLVELFKAWGKVLVVGTCAYFVLKYYFNDAMALQNAAVRPAIKRSTEIVLWAAVILCASTLIIAMIDVPWQIYSHTKKLRMSLQEIKDEFKDTEGKPEVKARIRQVQREAAQRRMMGAVPDADVVITNPTHYAVALKYTGGSGAPIVVAKGIEETALKIREIAKENNVPQMAAPPLARAIYAHTRIDDEIPEGLYTAVAQVLAYIFQVDQYAKGQGPSPDHRPNMPIPADLRVDANTE
ncbi:MAG: flagellar biosynthesis protein FlhB [Oleispira sp.]|nr:flagellar biosynthesis protein FlhB [Oleispira sp.]